MSGSGGGVAGQAAFMRRFKAATGETTSYKDAASFRRLFSASPV